MEQGSNHRLLSALQGDHVWLNPTSANKTSVAIGGIIKETKPDKIDLESEKAVETCIQVWGLGNWGPILGLPHMSCLTLDKSLYFSKCQVSLSYR